MGCESIRIFHRVQNTSQDKNQVINKSIELTLNLLWTYDLMLNSILHCTQMIKVPLCSYWNRQIKPNELKMAETNTTQCVKMIQWKVKGAVRGLKCPTTYRLTNVNVCLHWAAGAPETKRCGAQTERLTWMFICHCCVKPASAVGPSCHDYWLNLP